MNKLATAMLTALAALTLVLTGVAISPSATADGASPQLVDPLDGSTLPVGFTGPITLDTTGVTAGSQYTLDVRCNSDAFIWSHAFTADASTSRAFTLDQAIPEDGSCAVGIDDATAETSTHLADWTIVDPLALTNGHLSQSYFYPRVQDGYRDSVVIAWDQNLSSDAGISVLNSAGKVVRTDYLPDSRNWSWDGTGDNTRPVAVGTYRIKVSVQDPNLLDTHSFTKSVSVRSKVITERRSETKLGHRSSVSAASGCFVLRDPDFDLTTSLDCWGGRYAQAKYRFTVPASAKSISYSVSGARTGDICCQGKITKSGARAKNKKSFTVTVRVNGWRAYEIRRVKVSYKVPVRQ